jgi:hypothetical protein
MEVWPALATRLIRTYPIVFLEYSQLLTRSTTMSLRPEPREPVPEETGGPQKLSYIAERPCSPGNIHDATRKDWTRHSPIFRLTIDRFIGIISSRYKKSHIKLDLLGHSMKRLMTELTPKPVQILEYLTPCAQEQCYPPIFQELAHGLNLTEKHTRGGVHILEHEGLSAPAAIDDLRLSLQKPLPTALLHDLPLVGPGVMAGKPVEVFGPHQRLPIPPVAAAERRA